MRSSRHPAGRFPVPLRTIRVAIRGPTGRAVRSGSSARTVPAPTIRVNDGDRVRMVLKNELSESTVLHLHGLPDLPNAMDGVPDITQPPIKPGESFTQAFAKAGKLSYHDALFTSRKGSVIANAPAATVSLSAATQTIVYGENTTVSGSISNQLANEPVSLTSQPVGKGTQALASSTTQASGAFSFGVSPTIQTAYQAHYKTAASPSVDLIAPVRKPRPSGE